MAVMAMARAVAAMTTVTLFLEAFFWEGATAPKACIVNRE
jgi:hypothetical protein